MVHICGFFLFAKTPYAMCSQLCEGCSVMWRKFSSNLEGVCETYWVNKGVLEIHNRRWISSVTFRASISYVDGYHEHYVVGHNK